ncbi:hypothetical protein LTR37_001060 [Vermiconidia calcicola]|uniref:Uncharacterized protein n=1 Tax=Vermiconidia calcicola TaxID=1690605 RepID=A0ACC3NX25_9PEZI|nr:hypothetical protein LTR37_001060 [Vermiconidia calcicola]
MLSALCLLQLIPFTLGSPVLKPELELELEDLERTYYLERRQDETVTVTGMRFGVQPRLEVRQLEANADQWNIFLLGMRRFQQTDQSDATSYYQIAGIHGRPFQPWNDVPPADGNNSPGYCTHLLNLFLSWHRAYLALFEQKLYKHIVDAVNEFPAGSERQRYARAALSWRFPYWDWAAAPPSGQSVFPESMQSPTIDVTMPNGTTTIPNPLFSYRFHPVSVDDFYFNPFATWEETMRYPTGWDGEATSQNHLLGPVFDNSRVSFQDRLYNLFTNYDNFTEFGNEAWMHSGLQNADSLEALHDVIHGFLGSNGHMTFLDYSAFDPAFFLHHAMMDRCFALWQALYPDSYVEPMAAIQQTFTIKVGDVKDENSALEPFFSNRDRDYWTSASIRSTQTFGYTYPELVGNANISSVKEAINKLYGSSMGNSGLSPRGLSYRAADGRQRQYLANIVSQKLVLDGSYAVYLFMGDFDDTPSSWATSPNLVGTHAVFGALSSSDNAASTPRSRARRSDSAIQVTGTMPLTSMLLAKMESGELANMKLATVEGYLTDNLHWRVGMFDDTEVSAEDVADLSVTVVTARVLPAASEDAFPEWSEFAEISSITRGKPGGC